MKEGHWGKKQKGKRQEGEGWVGITGKREGRLGSITMLLNLVKYVQFSLYMNKIAIKRLNHIFTFLTSMIEDCISKISIWFFFFIISIFFLSF